MAKNTSGINEMTFLQDSTRWRIGGSERRALNGQVSKEGEGTLYKLMQWLLPFPGALGYALSVGKIMNS